MATFTTITLGLIITLTVLTASAIAMILAYKKFGKSWQLLICGIICAWASIVSCLTLSIPTGNTFITDLHSHPNVTATAVFIIYLVCQFRMMYKGSGASILAALISWLAMPVVFNWLWPAGTSDAAALSPIAGIFGFVPFLLCLYTAGFSAPYIQQELHGAKTEQTEDLPSQHQVIWQRTTTEQTAEEPQAEPQFAFQQSDRGLLEDNVPRPHEPHLG